MVLCISQQKCQILGIAYEPGLLWYLEADVSSLNKSNEKLPERDSLAQSALARPH